jgi:hypothetical protein
MIKRYFETELPVTNAQLYDIMVKRVSEDEREAAGFREFMDISDYNHSSMIYSYGNNNQVEFFNFGTVPISIEGSKTDEIKSKLEKLLRVKLTEMQTQNVVAA